MNIKKIFAVLSISALIAIPFIGITHAQEFTPPANQQTEVQGPPEILQGGFSDVIQIIRRLTNWLFTILLLLAVVFIIMAAYTYLSSGGGEGVEKAHKMIVYAMVALAVGFLSRGIVYVVEELVGQ